MDAFDVLGIEPNATDEEINAEWKRLARLTHPDAHPDATPQQRIALTQRMAAINAAYEELRNPLRRDELRHTRAQGHSSSSWDAPSRPREGASTSRRRHDSCELCGSIPSKRVSFQQVTGQVFRDLIRRFDAQLCRDCAQAVGREMQSKTLVTGWWGVFAVFRNLYAIASNSNSLINASRIAPPVSPSGYVTYPLPIGEPLFRRPRTWVGWAIVAALIGIGVPLGVQESNRPTIGVGACVSGYASVSAVSCDSRHDGKIVSIASSQYQCPASTEEYIPNGSRVYCVDTDR